MFLLLLLLWTSCADQEFKDNWTVTYKDVGADEYELVMEWDHVSEHYPVVARGVYNALSKNERHSGVCSETSTARAADGKPYWMPRMHARPVPAEVTEKTGVRFASVDWTPCGHKDIVICHAESHYDFHLYYVDQDELSSALCDGAKPMCPYHNADSNDVHLESERNQKFWKFMKGNIPKYADKAGKPREHFNYCVDPTSAIPRSGVHYGDKKETLQEWKNPVTILGSYDCKLTFFEPMFSWKWVNGRIWPKSATQWPKWESGEITYEDKNYHPLPTSWSVEVSHQCALLGYDGNRRGNSEPCHIKLTVRGKRCGKDLGIDCSTPPQTCAQATNCLNGKPLGFLPEDLKPVEQKPEVAKEPEEPKPVESTPVEPKKPEQPTDVKPESPTEPKETEPKQPESKKKCEGLRRKDCKGNCVFIVGERKCLDKSMVCGKKEKLKFRKGARKYKASKNIKSECDCRDSCKKDNSTTQKQGSRYFMYKSHSKSCFCFSGSVQSRRRSNLVHSGEVDEI